MAARRWLLGWMLVALLGAQAFGQAHRVVHGTGALQAHGVQGLAAVPEADAAGGQGWFATLVGGHELDSRCLLFDAVGQAWLAGVAALAAPALPPANLVQAFALASCAKGRCAPFQARGPPVSR